VYGTVSKSWFEYQIEMYRTQNALAGMNPIEVEKSVNEQYDLNYRFFIKKERLEDMAIDPMADSVLRTAWEYDGKGKIYSRNAEYWRQIQDYPHLENWKNTTAKVLVQFGESDFQAFSKADHQQIVNTVNYFHHGNATLKTILQQITSSQSQAQCKRPIINLQMVRFSYSLTNTTKKLGCLLFTGVMTF
jgi:hypothetical protein